MKKRILSILLCMAMVVAMLAGCGTSSDGTSASSGDSDASGESASADGGITLDGSWPEETIKIGVVVYDTTDEQFLAFQNYLEYLTQYYNIQFTYSESIQDSTAEFSFIDSCATAGCQGIIGYYATAEEQGAQEAIEQGMYYWGCDNAIYDALADNEKYAGRYVFAGSDADQNGDYLAGYQLSYSLAQQGCKHLLYCSGGTSFGVQMFLDRQAGFEAGVEAAQAEGMDVTYSSDTDRIEGWPGTDEFNASVSSALEKDYDGIATSFNVAAILQPVSESGKLESVKMATIGEVCDTYLDFVEMGAISSVVYDCEEVVFGNGVVQLINKITGYEELTVDAEGNAASTPCNRWVITDADTYNAILEYHNDGNYFVSAEDLAQCLGGLNPDATYDSICEYYEGLTVDKALEIIQ